MCLLADDRQSPTLRLSIVATYVLLQAAFWESTLWLRPGQALALSHESGHLSFVEVIYRDNALLAASRWRGWVGVRFAAELDAETAFLHMAATSAAPASRDDVKSGDWKLRPSVRAQCVAIQAADAYPIGQSILEALKADTFLEPPFAREVFCRRHHGAGVELDPPDVTSDAAATAFLEERRRTFDERQREAFDQALRRRTALVQGPPGAHLLLSICMSYSNQTSACS